MDQDKSKHDTQVMVKVSPGGSRYYIPIGIVDIKPFVGQCFPSLSDAALFYRRYANYCGFGIRKDTLTKCTDGSNMALRRYLLCNRQGVKSSYASKSEPKRRRITNKCNCKAKVTFLYVAHRGYVAYRFEERHTHPMVTEQQKQFLKNNQKFTPFHQDFIINCLKSNIGTSQAYKLYKNSVGAYYDVGTTIIDFMNFSRDLNAYMFGYDGQMVIDSLYRKKEMCEAFHFSYHLDDQNRPLRLFWADPFAIKSFSFFGDVVSADATYKSNRYDMVFVPFTGVDNNKCSITFAFGLLLHEDISSYVWLFENIKKSIGHEPFIILTDQDASVKFAVQTVFTTAAHRFCMWHIMFKVPVKVKVDASEQENFRKRFNGVVWSNELNQQEFEDSWKSIIIDFHLEDNTWLQAMFDLRHYWIPAYFQDFGNAIDSQRYKQNKLDLDSSTCNPVLKTSLPIEVQCASVFTLNVFHELQNEICEAAFRCGFSNFEKHDDVNHIYVTSSDGKEYIVKHNKSLNEYLKNGHA